LHSTDKTALLCNLSPPQAFPGKSFSRSDVTAAGDDRGGEAGFAADELGEMAKVGAAHVKNGGSTGGFGSRTVNHHAPLILQRTGVHAIDVRNAAVALFDESCAGREMPGCRGGRLDT